jgi:Arc/MetJ-type ribon-helix-helix transcriptional regulator
VTIDLRKSSASRTHKALLYQLLVSEVRIAGCKALLIETKHWYYKSMKRHTLKSVGKRKKNVKSSITLPPAELEIVNELMTKLDAKSKVEVIRQGLRLLQAKTTREILAAEFKRASELGRAGSKQALRDFEHLNAEGLPEEDEEYSKW